MNYLWVAVSKTLVLVLERGEGCIKLPVRFPIPPFMPPPRSSDDESSAAPDAAVVPLRSSSELLLLFVKLPAATLYSSDRVRVLGMEPGER